MLLRNFTTQKASLKIKQLKYVWIIRTLTTFHLRRPKRGRYVNTFFSHFSLFCRIFPQVFMQICFLRVLPQIVSHHIISIILSFWQENTLFLVADSAQRIKIQTPLFLETSFDIFNRRKLYESKSLIMKICLFYSSRNLRRARCQIVVGYNANNRPYHHTERIFSVFWYNANIL